MRRVRALVGAVIMTACSAGFFAVAHAQAITDAHLQAAVEAYHALGTDEEFDLVLPGVANQVETILIQQRPDLYRQIHELVLNAALELAARRAELTNDVARVWAQTFTEDELRQITAFYTSPAGRKLAEMGQPVMNETVAALEAWSERLSTELLDRVLQEFERRDISF